MTILARHKNNSFTQQYLSAFAALTETRAFFILTCLPLDKRFQFRTCAALSQELL